jgi:hypothetical protein
MKGMNPIILALIDSLSSASPLRGIEPVVNSFAVVFHFQNATTSRLENVASSRNQFLDHWMNAGKWWKAVVRAKFESEKLT